MLLVSSPQMGSLCIFLCLDSDFLSGLQIYKLFSHLRTLTNTVLSAQNTNLYNDGEGLHELQGPFSEILIPNYKWKLC